MAEEAKGKYKAEKNPVRKVVLIGASKVGKSSLLNRWANPEAPIDSVA
jgi:GTPase SAR1 family protein